MTLFWFRRDLRLNDNHGLWQALTHSKNVLPLFIFDDTILEELPQNDSRVNFIHESLANINNELRKNNTSLAVFKGNPLTVFKKLILENNITSVYANEDYEPAAIKRDSQIMEFLSRENISLSLFKDQVVFEKDEILKNDGTPYVVFTPYSKKWKEKLSLQPVSFFESEKKLNHLASHTYPFLSLEDIGFQPSEIKVKTINTSQKLIASYRLTRDFPALDQTSYASVHLRFGTISIRDLVQQAIQVEDFTYLNELIWREFFMQILWHFPHTVSHSFKPKYDLIKWNNNVEHFEKWCQGKTGYPIVDAGMRQLNTTGYMHNRVRMIVASFLTKHLLIDWRWGETYFALKLLDYEQSSNVGNWQWAAGSGVDAAPYFRIFNPTEQTKKFDTNLKYIKKWVPELETLSYPSPIVDHKTARELCLKTYKKALE